MDLALKQEVKMKKFQAILVLLTVLSLNAYSLTIARSTLTKADSLHISATDSIEYEIIIFDSGFQSWLITNAKPMSYHTNEYYQNKNLMLVAEWNNRVRTNRYRPPYEYEIEYSPLVDYGLEVNYQLYWYFRYMEQKFGFSLFGGRGR